jgi:hypothetical protein
MRRVAKQPGMQPVAVRRLVDLSVEALDERRP